MWEYFRKSTGRYYVKWRNKGSRKMYSKARSIHNWEFVNGPVPKGHHIHHINLDRTDDRIENLQLITASEHRFLHARIREDHKQIDGIEHRKCQCCGNYKLLDGFNIRNGGTYQGYCKECGRIKLQEWRETNREHHNQYHREYRKK